MEYIAIDGDKIGEKVERLIVNGRLDELSEYSLLITNFFKRMSMELEVMGCRIYYCGGDSILASISSSIDDSFFDMDKSEISFSVGISNTLEGAYLALKLSKAKGRKSLTRINLMKI